MAESSKTVSALADLVGGTVESGGEAVVVDVTHDSREVAPGWLYVAVRGENADGHIFVPQAVAAGAAAVCVDHPTGSEVPELVVDDTRQVMGELAAAVHDYPSTSLEVVGVTGTNGKTTVTHYVESIATHAGVSSGLVGTIHTRAAGATAPPP
jgi:UDP-N-acetylmuramoyl-L-alanyl-D-glutamate--2,6-diaminopimelate ligase